MRIRTPQRRKKIMQQKNKYTEAAGKAIKVENLRMEKYPDGILGTIIMPNKETWLAAGMPENGYFDRCTWATTLHLSNTDIQVMFCSGENGGISNENLLHILEQRMRG
jgi:hypothetical protein